LKTYSQQFSVSTSSKIELINITSQVSQIVEQSKIEDGIALVYSFHTTTAVLINENESRLIKDLQGAIKKLVPWDEKYAHNDIDNNAPAHIASAFIGNNTSVFIEKGKIQLGTWQSIFLIELDGPRARQVSVKIIGE
jgi:secondary thiamine-phosphate synthase enzyme